MISYINTDKLKAFQALKAAAAAFRENPEFDTEELLSALGTGEAAVSMLDEKGIPGMVQHAFILPPQSRMGMITDGERDSAVKQSNLYLKYSTPVDPDSAYEFLERRKQQMELQEQKEEAAEAAEKEQEKAEKAAEKAREKAEREAEKAAERERKEAERRVKSVASTAAGSVGRELGHIFGGKLGGKFGKTLGGNIGASLGRNILGTLFRH